VLFRSWLVTRRRRRAYEAFCRDRGYRFDAQRSGEEARHAATCRLFTEGHGRRWTFTIVGTSGGTPFTAFEYRWTTGSGKSSRSHCIGGLLWTVERSLPTFFLAPEGWWDKVAAYFGGQDMDFDDSPGFSHSYHFEHRSRGRTASDRPACPGDPEPGRAVGVVLVALRNPAGDRAAGKTRGQELLACRQRRLDLLNNANRLLGGHGLRQGHGGTV